MAKIIVLGDLHFDLSSSVIDNEIIYNNQIRLWKETIFPLMKERNITQILQVGDFTDKRTTFSQFIQHKLKEDIFDILEKENYVLNYLLGNHDIFYTTNRSIYTLEIFQKAYQNNFKVFTEPMLWKFDKKDSKTFFMVPWLCHDDEKANVQKIIKRESPDLIFGHFEIADFHVSKNSKDTHGLDKNYFKDIPVWTGHYHLKQEASNIFYIGTPSENTWEDFEEEKGIYILDTDTLEYEFIRNDISMRHLKVYLDSEQKTIEVVGLGQVMVSKISAKTDYSIFKNHKLKIYIDKDNSVNKKIIDIIDEIAFKIKVEITNQERIKQEESEEITDSISTDFNIKSTIYNNLETDYQKLVFNDIYKKSEMELK